MDAGRASVAERASGGVPSGADGDDQGAIVVGDILDDEAREVREQALKACRCSLAGEACPGGAHVPLLSGLVPDPHPPEVEPAPTLR
jgi:hypothetical protein